jgi:hypothetical protein
MEFGLNESQEILRNSARSFFSGECPISEVRRLMETDTAYDTNLWRKLTEQGYTGIIFAEEYGGVGLGKVELILLMEEAGRALLPGPFFSTVVLSGSIIDAVATAEQKMKYLAPICRGEARATVAILESSASWDLNDMKMTAAGGKLRGEKLFVSDAAIADCIVVLARNGVFLVAKGAPGLKISLMVSLDLTRKLYAVQLHDTPAEKLGDFAAVTPAIDVATTALVAEMVGGMQRTLDRRICENAQTVRQDDRLVPGSAASMRGYVSGDGEFTLRCILCGVGVAGKYPGRRRSGVHREDLRQRCRPHGRESRNPDSWGNGLHVGERFASLLSARQGVRDRIWRRDFSSRAARAADDRHRFGRGHERLRGRL